MIDVVDVLCDFILVISLLLSIARSDCDSLSDLDNFKTFTLVPLLEELLVLVLFEEDGSGELETPVWNIGILHDLHGVLCPSVDNGRLIVGCHTESPNLIFSKTVVNKRQIIIWRVGVERLTLDVVEFKVCIIIIHGNDCRVSNNIFLVSLIGLHSFEVIDFIHGLIIPITVMVRVVIDILVPSEEGIIDKLLSDGTFQDLVSTEGKSTVELEGKVSLMGGFVIDTIFLVSATETFLKTVLMDSPHSVDTLVN